MNAFLWNSQAVPDLIEQNLTRTASRRPLLAHLIKDFQPGLEPIRDFDNHLAVQLF